MFRGFSFLVPLFFHTMASCSVALLALGISQRPLGAHPNLLNLWELQTEKSKEILNI
jgi:hypothetical protein